MRSPTILRTGLLAALFAAGTGSSTGSEETARFAIEARDAFEQGMGAWGVRYDPAAGGVALLDRALIEDDGPGALPYVGKDWYKLPQPGRIPLRDGRRVRKVLRVPRPEAFSARLVLGATMGDARVTVNGETLAAATGRYRPVPVELLRRGDNIIELSEGRRESLALYSPLAELLANAPERAAEPRRSYRSDNGGRTWAPIEGELFVRLELIQYAEEGTLLSPPILLAPSDGPLRFPARIETLRLEAEGRQPEGTRAVFSIRTGPTPLPGEGWSVWTPIEAFAPTEHAYLQWRAILQTADPRQTPVLDRVIVTVTRRPAPPDWASALRVEAAHNPELRFTSIPFVYEDFRHPKLAALRRNYELDRVVEGAASEFERMVRLRQWTYRRIKYDAPNETYPAWDANEIIERGTGFCVQFAIAQMQVMQSMGFNARFVFGYNPGPDSGHEVTEVWSNEYDKWILMDGHFHHVDPETRVPLGMMEIHERLVRAYYGRDRMITPENRPKDQSGDFIWTVRGDRLEPDPAVRQASDLNPAISPRWNRWAVIRMMPRNDFLSRPRPCPSFQGFGWEWSGYAVWRQPQTPTSYNARYAFWTDRRSDWDWTLNRVRFDVAPGGTRGAVEFQMGTQTPGFETFEARLNEGPWHAQPARFTQTLSPGENRIELRARNVLGVAGAPSYVRLNYQSDAAERVPPSDRPR